MAAAMFEALLVTSAFDQNAPHRLGCRGEKVCAAIPLLGPLTISVGLVPHQPQVGFVHQGRWLERLSRLLAGQFLGSKLAQLLIHDRQQQLGGLWIARFDLRQNAGHIAHYDEEYALGWVNSRRHDKTPTTVLNPVDARRD